MATSDKDSLAHSTEMPQTFSSEINKLRFREAFQRQKLNSLRNPLGNSVEFQCFPKLPAELRLQIWKIACFNEPRVIELRENDPRKGRVPISRWPGLTMVGSLPLLYLYCPVKHPPAILHTTSESRHEARKYYRRKVVDFFTDYTLRQHFPENTIFTEAYFNFDIDVLHPVFNPVYYFGWAEIVAKSRTLRNFRRIAIAQRDYQDLRQWQYDWLRAADFLVEADNKIEEIIILHGPNECFESELQLAELPPDEQVTLYSGWTFNFQQFRRECAHWLSEHICQFMESRVKRIEELEAFVFRPDPDESKNGGMYCGVADGKYSEQYPTVHHKLLYGDYPVDPPSEDEDEDEADVTNISAMKNSTKKKVKPRKAFPKITHMKFREDLSKKCRNCKADRTQ